LTKEVLREPSIAQVAMAASSEMPEVGTSKMPARPYIKPATDKNFTAEKFARKVKGHLE